MRGTGEWTADSVSTSAGPTPQTRGRSNRRNWGGAELPRTATGTHRQAQPQQPHQALGCALGLEELGLVPHRGEEAIQPHLSDAVPWGQGAQLPTGPLPGQLLTCPRPPHPSPAASSASAFPPLRPPHVPAPQSPRSRRRGCGRGVRWRLRCRRTLFPAMNTLPPRCSTGSRRGLSISAESATSC